MRDSCLTTCDSSRLVKDLAWITKHIKSWGCAGEEGPPPPIVVLAPQTLLQRFGWGTSYGFFLLNKTSCLLRSDVVPSYHGKSMHRAKRYHIVYNLILMSHVLIWFYTCFSLQVPRRINGDSQRWDFSFDSIWSICSFAPRMLSINILNGPHWVLMCKVSAFDNLSTTSLLSKLDKILYFCLRIALSLLRLLSSGHVSFLLYLLVSGLCYQSCFHASAL